MSEVNELAVSCEAGWVGASLSARPVRCVAALCHTQPPVGLFLKVSPGTPQCSKQCRAQEQCQRVVLLHTKVE